MLNERYLAVVTTGIQTLCIIGAGRLAANRGLFEPTSVTRILNRFVVVVCLPALQFWLLAIKTDMRNMEVGIKVDAVGAALAVVWRAVAACAGKPSTLR